MLAIIGQIIRQLREENGITIEELSERAGIDADKLAKIENNQANPSLGILIRLSRAIRMPTFGSPQKISNLKLLDTSCMKKRFLQTESSILSRFYSKRGAAMRKKCFLHLKASMKTKL